MSQITVATEHASFVETAVSAPPGVRIPIEVRTTVSDPFEAYRRIRDPDTDGFYLETTGGQSGWGYFGVTPVERLQVGADATSPDVGSPTVEAIEALLDRERLVRGDCEVPYPCGAFGWLSYDVARELEELPATTAADGLPRPARRVRPGRGLGGADGGRRSTPRDCLPRRRRVRVADAVAAVFPGGTITGAPKPRTREIIDEVETSRRGPYTGSVGVFGFDDRATLNITIRTLVRHGDEYRLRVGAGVVADSDPSREYQETLDKAQALVTAIDEALGDRGALTVGSHADTIEGTR